MKLKEMLSSFLILSASACSYVHPDFMNLIEGANPTFLVKNSTLEPLKIRNRWMGVVGTVMPGEEKCMYLRNRVGEGYLRLNFRNEGRTYYLPEFNPVRGSGWAVRIGMSPSLDVLSLAPSKRCK